MWDILVRDEHSGPSRVLGYTEIMLIVSILGICLVQAANRTMDSTVICTTVALRSFSDVESALQDQANSTSSASAIQAGVSFANSAIFNVLCPAFLTYMGSLLFDLVFIISTRRSRMHLSTEKERENLRKRQNRYLKASLFITWASLSIAFSAAVAVTQSVRALEVNLGSMVSVSAGQISLALHWLIAIISGIISVCWTQIYRVSRKPNKGVVSGQGNQLDNGKGGEGQSTSEPGICRKISMLTLTGVPENQIPLPAAPPPPPPPPPRMVS